MSEPIRFSGPEYEAQYFPDLEGPAYGCTVAPRASNTGEFHVYDLAGRHACGRVVLDSQGDPFFHLEGCAPGLDLGLVPKATSQIQAAFRPPHRVVRTGHE